LTKEQTATLYPAVSGVGLLARAMLGTARCALIRSSALDFGRQVSQVRAASV
jgi:hypothetical protein